MLLKKLANGQTSFSVEAHPEINDIVNTLIAKSSERQKSIRDNMKDGGTPLNDPRVVSVEELTLLVG